MADTEVSQRYAEQVASEITSKRLLPYLIEYMKSDFLEQIATSQPEEAAKREQLYNMLHALVSFEALIKALASAHNLKARTF